MSPKTSRASSGRRNRGRNPGKDPRRNRTHRFGWRLIQQVPRQAASDHRKPDGLFVITPAMGPAFVETLPVRKFHGVGPATAAKMARLGIKTGLDLRAQSLAFLQEHFGKAGAYYYGVARGVDERPVRANRIRKSVGAENTFPAYFSSYEAARDALAEIVDKVWRHCEGAGIRGRTVTIKVKFANFHQITRSRTGQMQIATRSELNSSATSCSDLSFRSQKAFGFWASLYRHSGQMRPNRSGSSTCPFRRSTSAAAMA